MNLANTISRQAKLHDLRWLLSSTTSRGALRHALRALLVAPSTLGHCRLRRAKFEPGRKLTAQFDARLNIQGTDRYRTRPVAVTWRPDEDGDRGHGSEGLPELEAEALRRGLASPFGQLTAALPEWNMQIQVSPLDARFPQLVRLSDPRYVREMLAASFAATRAVADQPRPSGYAVTCVHYRPGQRHVLRYDPVVELKEAIVFAKLYKPGKGALVSRVAKGAADWLAEHGDGVTCVRPLAYVAEDEVVLYPRVCGAPISERLRRPGRSLARWLERTGRALQALHQMPQEEVGPLQGHEFGAEVEEVAHASRHIAVLLPSVGGAIEALLARARELHDKLPHESPTFTHGDFKSDHVWVKSGHLTFIDFDTAYLSDPALDIGKFLADLQFWGITYKREGAEQAQERFLAGYTPGVPSERVARARLYEAVETIKMAVRRVRLFDHDWEARTEQLIGRAQTVMNSVQFALGLPSRPLQLAAPQRMVQHSPPTPTVRRAQAGARGGQS